MAKLSLDIEGWPDEALIAAVLASGPIDGPRADTSKQAAAVLLRDFGGFSGLSRATVDELETHLSRAPALRRPPRLLGRRIAAAFELGRRAAAACAAPTSIACSDDVAAWARTRLSGLDHEELWLLALDGRSRLLAVRCVAKGGLHGVGIRAADPLRLALRAAATGFVLVHNHPSGDPTPSPEDIAFTKRIAAAAAIVGTPMLDHVVVTRDGYASVPFESAPASLGSAADLASRAVEA
jgi:DNA repair protein RadC